MKVKPKNIINKLNFENFNPILNVSSSKIGEKTVIANTLFMCEKLSVFCKPVFVGILKIFSHSNKEIIPK
jgi:hypothetical protein